MVTVLTPNEIYIHTAKQLNRTIVIVRIRCSDDRKFLVWDRFTEYLALHTNTLKLDGSHVSFDRDICIQFDNDEQAVKLCTDYHQTHRWEIGFSVYIGTSSQTTHIGC